MNPPLKRKRGIHATLRQLRVFETVARQGSFTRAAEELHLSQPTVSMQVKQLTEAVDQPLLVTAGRRVQLTELGQELYRTARDMFGLWERFEMHADNMRGLRKGCLRLSCVTTAKYFVPRLLGPFCERHPGIDIRLEICNRDGIVERLARNDDDLYVMSVPPQHLDIACHPFLDNPMVAVAPASHPMVGRAPITLAQLGAQRILSRERGSGSRMAIERHFREHGVEFMPKMEIGSTEAIKQAVIAGLGVTLMPLHAILMDPMTGQLAMLEVETLPIPGAWFAVHPGNRRLSIVAQAFLHYLVTEGAELMQRFEQHATTARGLVAAPAGQLSGGSQ